MKKKKKLLGGIGTIVVVIIFIMICSGAFDDQASDLTDGAYGHDSIGASDDIKYNKEDGSIIQEKNKKVEISGYINISEDDLIKKFGFEKNENGFYPTEDKYVFICMDNVVSGISLRKVHEKDAYTLFGLAIGDSYDSIADTLQEKFTEYGSYSITDGTRIMFVEKDTSFALGIDYDSNNKIVGMTYSNEKMEVDTESETTETETTELETTEEISSEGTEIVADNLNVVQSYQTWVGETILKLNLEYSGTTGYMALLMDGTSEPEVYEIYKDGDIWYTTDGTHIIEYLQNGNIYVSSNTSDLPYAGEFELVSQSVN